MPKYTVLRGFNCPDPSGARNEQGRPVELRFEVGEEISETSVSPSVLEGLVRDEIVRSSEPSDGPKKGKK